MKGKVLFGAGIAAGYVLGSRSGRAAYEKLKARAAALWESQPVQDKVTAATDAVKEKAPEVSEQLGEAARRAGTVIGSAVRRDNSPTGTRGRDEAGRQRGRRHPRAQHASGDREPWDLVRVRGFGGCRRRVRPGAERPARAGLVRRRRRHPGRSRDQRRPQQGFLATPGLRAGSVAPVAAVPITTVASSSPERATRAVSPLRMNSPAVREACRRLVSISRWPPGASHCGAAAATRCWTCSPSVPPSRETRGSCRRASCGRVPISAEGTYGALTARMSTRPRSRAGRGS